MCEGDQHRWGNGVAGSHLISRNWRYLVCINSAYHEFLTMKSGWKSAKKFRDISWAFFSQNLGIEASYYPATCIWWPIIFFEMWRFYNEDIFFKHLQKKTPVPGHFFGEICRTTSPMGHPLQPSLKLMDPLTYMHNTIPIATPKMGPKKKGRHLEIWANDHRTTILETLFYFFGVTLHSYTLITSHMQLQNTWTNVDMYACRHYSYYHCWDQPPHCLSYGS